MVTHSPSRLRGPLSLDLPTPSRPAHVADEAGKKGIRWSLVNRIRAEIAAGKYDTPERLAAALNIFCRRHAAE